MKYMGSKARIAKDILPIILKDRKEGQFYVEPFVGGANTIMKVTGNRIGADNNEYLIELHKKLQDGWKPIENVTFEFYEDVKNNKEKYEKHIVAYVGLAFTFGAMWFSSFVGNTNDKACIGRDRIGESYRNILKHQKNINGIDFIYSCYQDLDIPAESIIYCDPPYENTAKYKGSNDFNHKEFWQWCRDMTKIGHKVFVSEYNAPNDFKCIWEKELNSQLSKKKETEKYSKSTEKLFIYAN